MKLLDGKLPLLLDGATGTNLFAAGMPAGVCPEQWILEHPQVIQKLQQSYADAGSDIIYAPTFGANRVALIHFGLEDKVAEMNRELIKITRAAVGHRVLVAGDMSSTALQAEPFGETSFEEMIDIYREQASALKAAGADLLVCETLMSLTDARAAVLAANECKMPVFVTITVNQNGRTISGSSLLQCVLTLQAMGAAAVGLNCSTGPEDMAEFIRPVMPYAKVPIIAKPNGGRMIDGVLQNVVTPEEFAQGIKMLLDAGARIVGGCCGTTASHIAQVRWMLKEYYPEPLPEVEDVIAACYENSVFFLGDTLDLSDPLTCTSDLADEFIELEDAGCNAVLVEINDVNDAQELGMNAYMSHLPIAVRAYTYEGLEEALRLYQGRLIIDSQGDVSEQDVKNLAAKYGAIVL